MRKQTYNNHRINQLIPIPSPTHARRLRLHRFSPVFVLTTQNAHNHTLQHTPLTYRRHGNKLYLIASPGEVWYQNLCSHPVGTAAVGLKSYRVYARPVSDAGEIERVLHLFRRSALDECTIVRLDLYEETLLLSRILTRHRWVLPALVMMGVGLNAAIERTNTGRSDHDIADITEQLTHV